MAQPYSILTYGSLYITFVKAFANLDGYRLVDFLYKHHSEIST